jgi:hypothetical protein
MSTTVSDAEPSLLSADRALLQRSLRSAIDVAATAFLLGMPLARWHGWSFAEAVLGLGVAAGVAVRLSWPRPPGVRARVVEPALLALWALAFGATAVWSEPPRRTLAGLLAADAPPEFVRQLSTCGPLSVLAREGWYREIQEPELASVLALADDSGRSLWLRSVPASTRWTLESFAQELARDIEADELSRELERRDGTVEGFRFVERLYAVESANELRLLVALEQDGHLIAGWGVSPGLDSQEGVEAIRDVVRTVRACGDVRDDAPALVEALAPSLLEAIQ